MINKIVKVLKQPSIFFLKIFTFFPRGRVFNAKYLLNRHYLKEEGWISSAKLRLPIDGNGNETPWFTYGMIYFLKTRLAKDFKVFEYGSGNSTIWFSKRVLKVVSLEHHKGWYEQIKNKLENISNVEYVYKDLPSKDYENEILNYTMEFDIVIIDGRKRNQCAINSVNALKEDGVIIWDDSHRDEYKEGINYLLNNGFKRIDFRGLKAEAYMASFTSIFYKTDNVFNI